MSKGTKRASPGAEEEKDALAGIELSEEAAAALTAVNRDVQRVDIFIERQSYKLMKPVFEKRRDVVKNIDRFWAVALMNHGTFGIHCQHQADQLALTYLEDVWVARDEAEPRVFTLEFKFKENPHFKDQVLKKVYTYTQPPAPEKNTVDENGVSDVAVDFSWEHHVKAGSIKIDWKDPAKALTKLYPRESAEGDDEDPAEPGSFFNFFEHESDPFDLGLCIANDVFPEAIEYFLGNAGNGELDSDDEDSDDDDDAEEIDLEKPRAKKQKI
ncbi:hypothetical protein CYLTODRAFT_422549 [Cylindrobasidium torrendii FP15055 ss-10]|uniref:Nucleosome assembly protein n=1 Tax=Cylindrobasidium torrendii FP15055 ss-10 TaxID=1314674 RepID=A0A0D7BAA3_9AGAR|nr:hypothetical protein CYLTODRAFT_422549 [Cylindrobasidium torrendii FP15055 ss-10]